MQQTSHKRQLK